MLFRSLQNKQTNCCSKEMDGKSEENVTWYQIFVLPHNVLRNMEKCPQNVNELSENKKIKDFLLVTLGGLFSSLHYFIVTHSIILPINFFDGILHKFYFDYFHSFFQKLYLNLSNFSFIFPFLAFVFDFAF